MHMAIPYASATSKLRTPALLVAISGLQINKPGKYYSWYCCYEYYYYGYFRVLRAAQDLAQYNQLLQAT